MAGDWIKMRTDLFEHPKVFKLADALGVDEFSVVGMLFCFWSWADKHSVDGRVDAATSRLVDKCAHRTGFADALVSVGWLEIDADGITIPRFNEHNGDSAKERTLKNQRQARWRAGKKDGAVDARPSTHVSTEAPTREEKRREEKYSSSLRSEESAPKRAQPPSRPAEVSEQVWADWLQLRKSKRAPVTATVLDGAKSEAQKAGMALEEFLGIWCRRGSQGLEASWLKPEECAKGQVSPATFHERQLASKRAEFARITGQPLPGSAPLREVIDITPRQVVISNA